MDCIFAPRVVSVEQNKFLCPKFLGLPEIARFGVPDLPPLLDVEINVHEQYQKTCRDLKRLAASFEKRPRIIEEALRSAELAQENYEAALRLGKTPQDVLSGTEDKHRKESVRVAVLGHAYNLNDKFISMNLLSKLREFGAEVITSEMLKAEEIEQGAAITEKEIYWTFGKELMGSAFHLMEEGKINGIILVAAFGCGPDSLVCEMVERIYRRGKKAPVLMLTIDEHTGEAGVVTRLEAFIDMLRWREAV